MNLESSVNQNNLSLCDKGSISIGKNRKIRVPMQSLEADWAVVVTKPL